MPYTPSQPFSASKEPSEQKVTKALVSGAVTAIILLLALVVQLFSHEGSDSERERERRELGISHSVLVEIRLLKERCEQDLPRKRTCIVRLTATPEA